MPPTRSGSKNGASNECIDPANAEYITTSQLEKILEDNRNEIRETIKSEFTAILSEFSAMKDEMVRLQGEVESVTNVANNSQKIAENLQTRVTKLEEENNQLKHKLHNTVNDQHAALEMVEDCKNRQLRKTVVFRGIPEKKIQSEVNTDGTLSTRPENWDDTAGALAESMSQALPNTTIEQASKMVERCHRSKPNPKYKGTGPRPIFAAFLDWRDSELVKVSYRKNSGNVFAEQKVGPRTTARRNMALKLRRELLDERRITNAYVAFPARLMTKDSSARGAKYTLWKDFSEEPVPVVKRR